MEQVDNKTSKSKKSNGDSSLTVGLSIIMALFLIGLIGWGIWAAGHYLVVKSIADSNFRDGIIAFVIVIIAAVVGYSFYRYLRKGISTEKKNLDILMKEFSDFLEKQKNETSQISANVEMELNKALDKIATNFKKSITVDFSVEQRSEIFQRLNEAIATNINNDFIEKVHNSIRNELKTSIQIRAEEITSDFDRISKRLLNEIKDLRLTSFRNLGIGSFVTVIALTSLIYFVLNEKFNIDDKMSIVIHFLPRLSLAIFIELFAFFFLKLYRTNLNEIKYYHYILRQFMVVKMI
jgi:hypothetical protein